MVGDEVADQPLWPTCGSCGRSLWQGRCGRRVCESGWPAYATRYGKILKAALIAAEADGKDIDLFTVTAPGRKLLPFDPAVCAHRGRHRHSGPEGCRVYADLARRWNRDAQKRWSKLYHAAIEEVRRRHPKMALRIAALVPEPQARGLIHLHAAVSRRRGNLIDRMASDALLRALKRLAPAYGFSGDMTRGVTREKPGRFGKASHLASYLATYLRPSPRRKHDLRALLADLEVGARRHPVTGRRLENVRALYVDRELQRASGVTMAYLRFQSALWVCGWSNDAAERLWKELGARLTVEGVKRAPPPEPRPRPRRGLWWMPHLVNASRLPPYAGPGTDPLF